ncbi:MAG: 3'-5' exonuclease [Hydrogenophaga sp.]|nr:3'-5' exonuclease [Hydrogenophaga sp.]
MNNLMIDTETMGTGPDGALIAIGAVFFDEATGQMGDEFYRVINLATAVQEGGQIDAATVMWWLGQDDAARRGVQFGGVHIREALQEFMAFCGRRASEADLVVWGCSPTFDCLKIERALWRLGMQAPWRYYNERCYRTVRERAPSVPQAERTGMHNALEDAKYQAQHLLAIAAARRARSVA